jgi:hypothetical protein
VGIGVYASDTKVSGNMEQIQIQPFVEAAPLIYANARVRAKVGIYLLDFIRDNAIHQHNVIMTQSQDCIES